MFEFDSSFEEELSHALTEQGIAHSVLFRVPGSEYILDFYISAPIRGFIEVIGAAYQPEAKRQMFERLDEIYRQFSYAIVPFVISTSGLSSKDRQFLEDIPSVLIEFPWEQDNPSAWCAKQIYDRLASPETLLSAIGTAGENNIIVPKFHKNAEVFSRDTISNTGEISDVIVSFRALIAPDDFQKLRYELSELVQEFDDGHYTSGALRVGRTLEYIAYTLARAWDVTLDNATLEILESLQASFNQMSSNLIAYVNGEEEGREKARKELRKTATHFSSKIDELPWRIDEKHEVKEKIAKINTHAVLRNIKRKYIKFENIRKEFDLLFESKLIEDVLNLRNKAAHANTSGENSEISKEELNQMISSLRTVLFHLSNVANLVAFENN